MKKFYIGENKYLEQKVLAFYNCDYVGYQKPGNPDFINHLKNMTNQYNELDLVEDFVQVSERFVKDMESIFNKSDFKNFTVCVMPRSKRESKYKQSQLMFKKAISSCANKLGFINGTDAITRVKDTKTTHNWRLENNTGDNPYKGITKDTCRVDLSKIKDKNIVLVDDIYTEGVNVIEDCIQYLFDLGAKSVILYVTAKTR